MAARRRCRGSITVDVEISDLLSEVDDDLLLEEIKVRDLGPEVALGCDRTDAEEAILLLRCGRTSDALTLLERSLFPKFRTREACEEALAKLRVSA